MALAVFKKKDALLNKTFSPRLVVNPSLLPLGSPSMWSRGLFIRFDAVALLLPFHTGIKKDYLKNHYEKVT